MMTKVTFSNKNIFFRKLLNFSPNLPLKHFYFIEFSDSSTFELKNFKLIEHIFTNFGDLIKYLSIDFEFIEENVGIQVVTLINNKCFEELNSVIFDNCFGNVLSKLETTFPKVNKLQFSSHSSKKFQINPTNRKFNELFPNLNSLVLLQTRITDWTSIIGPYPMLESLESELPAEKTLNGIDETQFIKLFEDNKQITEIEFRRITLKLLKEINDLLINFDTLTINSIVPNHYLNYQGDGIRSQCITYLTINGNEFPLAFFFDKLEQLNLHIGDQSNDKWFEFIKYQVNKSLKSIHIYIQSMTKEQYITIPEFFPSLEKVIVNCQSKFEANDVLNFIDKSKSLKSIELSGDISVEEQLTIQTKMNRLIWDIGFTPYQNGDKRTKLLFKR